MTTAIKAEWTAKILDILSNPDEAPPNRTELAVKVGMSRENLYNHFTPAELDQLYRDALLLRRERMAAQSGVVDAALLKAVKAGDVQAIKLYYQRHEGWSPTTKIEGDITHMTLTERLKQIEKEEAGASTPSPLQIETTDAIEQD